MNKIVVDAALRSRLHEFTEPLEFCDESGRIIGRLFPAIDLSDFEPDEPEISEEELRRREQSSEWYSTAQVLDRLRNP